MNRRGLALIFAISAVSAAAAQQQSDRRSDSSIEKVSGKMAGVPTWPRRRVNVKTGCFRALIMSEEAGRTVQISSKRDSRRREVQNSS